ncbi:hypothetical protein OSB04_017289 [Centaurea solstitialis]|uniref:Uncharacterized protein n=1 Tax=Centaurea solstitialis TaxID=347529 RepID=A0AA38T2M7_9ASTR|nr:hypothetical protein OSB04_017289 [Centaurea solstitialis]
MICCAAATTTTTGRIRPLSHDEVPKEVNSIILEWAVNIERKLEILEQTNKDGRKIEARELYQLSI